MDELKRVTGDRDAYKKKFEESEQRIAGLESESANVQRTNGVEAPVDKADASSIDTPSASIKSPVSSIRRIFSPVPKSEPFPSKEASEEFFSYDDEVPKLQADVEAKTVEVVELKIRVTALEKDLAVAQESSSGLVANLEKATRELNDMMEASAAAQTEKEEANRNVLDWTNKLQTSQNTLDTIEAALEEQKKVVGVKSDQLEKQKDEYEAKLSSTNDVLAKQKEAHDKELKSLSDARDEAHKARDTAEKQFNDFRESIAADTKKMQELAKERDASPAAEKEKNGDAAPAEDAPAPGAASGAAKKKNNRKKKKGGAAAKDVADLKESAEAPSASTGDLQAQIIQLKVDLADRDTRIFKLQSKGKTEADLREELENMQENFLQVGQSHVEAKEAIKMLEVEKTTLQARITSLETELQTANSQTAESTKTGSDFQTLNEEYEALKLATATLQTDLSATQQLASARYKDLVDLKDVLSKAQPELKTLRAESTTLKSTKEELASKTSELRRLEARDKDLKVDMASFKKQAKDRDELIQGLEEKVVSEGSARTKAEDQLRFAQRDARKAEADKVHLAASNEKLSAELAKVNEEAGKLRTKVRDLEAQVEKLSCADQGLRDEVALRGSQYENAQGLISSMRDQSHEMAMQLKESKEQCESLEEELGEVQRLLGERTREGETMRRLLADVDGRADAKVRDIKERMEKAIEERERIDHDTTREARRRARESDDLKTSIKTLEKDLKKSIEAREDLEEKVREQKKRSQDLQSKEEVSRKENEDLHTAMGEVRTSLDRAVKQARDAERARSELRKVVDEANGRYEALQKEFKTLQARGSGRSSVDSGRGGGGGGGAQAAGGAGGVATAGGMDYVYLKTILLQFLEVKDKKVRMSLVQTVLGRLLCFDK